MNSWPSHTPPNWCHITQLVVARVTCSSSTGRTLRGLAGAAPAPAGGYWLTHGHAAPAGLADNNYILTNRWWAKQAINDRLLSIISNGQTLLLDHKDKQVIALKSYTKDTNKILLLKKPHEWLRRSFLVELLIENRTCSELQTVNLFSKVSTAC